MCLSLVRTPPSCTIIADTVLIYTEFIIGPFVLLSDKIFRELIIITRYWIIDHDFD